MFSQAINKAMQKERQELTIGVLDIYGFEIFMVSTYLMAITAINKLYVTPFDMKATPPVGRFNLGIKYDWEEK